MSDSTNLLQNVQQFDISEQLDAYTKVVIKVSDELSYTAGNDIGRTLTIENPWGTQEMANNLLNSFRGFQYQPYTAEGSLLDPAAELGDGVSILGVYGGLYVQKSTYGHLYTADISAPKTEEIDDKVKFIPQPDRVVERKFLETKATLKIQADLISAEVEARINDVEKINAKLSVQADQIAAKVSKTGGDSRSFGWTLTDSSWELQSNSTVVFKATSSGVEVRGKITATSGKIGGFDILSNYLSYNGQTWGGTNSIGIYLGSNGIQLGRNFRVDNQGNLYATSGTFTGAVRAGNIQYGDDAGYMSGYGISSHSLSGNRLKYNTVGTSYTSSGINTSLGYADWSYGVLNGWNIANNINCRTIVSTADMTAKNFYLNGYEISRSQKTVKDGNGNNVTIRYLSW